MAEVTARCHTSSSALTSMRRAWKVRLAGWPPRALRRGGHGPAQQLDEAGGPVNGSFSRSRTMADAIRPAKRSSP